MALNDQLRAEYVTMKQHYKLWQDDLLNWHAMGLGNDSNDMQCDGTTRPTSMDRSSTMKMQAADYTGSDVKDRARKPNAQCNLLLQLLRK